MLKTKANPGDYRSRLSIQMPRERPRPIGRSSFKDLTLPFYGYNRPARKVSEGVRQAFWLQGMMGGHAGLLLSASRHFRKTGPDRKI